MICCRDTGETSPLGVPVCDRGTRSLDLPRRVSSSSDPGRGVLGILNRFLFLFVTVLVLVFGQEYLGLVLKRRGGVLTQKGTVLDV